MTLSSGTCLSLKTPDFEFSPTTTDPAHRQNSNSEYRLCSSGTSYRVTGYKKIYMRAEGNGLRECASKTAQHISYDLLMLNGRSEYSRKDFSFLRTISCQVSGSFLVVPVPPRSHVRSTTTRLTFRPRRRRGPTPNLGSRRRRARRECRVQPERAGRGVQRDRTPRVSTRPEKGPSAV